MNSKREIVVDATLDNLDTVMGFLEDALEKGDCPMKVSMKIAVAFEEIYVNIANYAYGTEIGKCTIEVFVSDNNVKITIRDRGVEFNPLKQEEPDITLSAEDRKIGGLGIYMTKKTMDKVEYLRNSDENILMMEKAW